MTSVISAAVSTLFCTFCPSLSVHFSLLKQTWGWSVASLTVWRRSTIWDSFWGTLTRFRALSGLVCRAKCHKFLSFIVRLSQRREFVPQRTCLLLSGQIRRERSCLVLFYFLVPAQVDAGRSERMNCELGVVGQLLVQCLDNNCQVLSMCLIHQVYESKSLWDYFKARRGRKKELKKVWNDFMRTFT